MINLFISNILSFFILTYLCDSLLNKRIRNKKYIGTVFFVIVLFVTYMNGYKISIISTISLTISFIIYVVLLYKDSMIKSFVILISFFVIYAVSEVMSANILNIVVGLQASSSKNTFLYTIAIILSNFLSFSLVYLLVKMITLFKWNDLPKESLLILILPISTMLLILNIGDLFELLKNDIALIVIMIGLIISNYITIYLFLRMINMVAIERKLQKIQLEKEMSDLRYSTLNNLYESNFKFIHDVNRSIIQLQNNLKDKNYNDFEGYLAELNHKLLKELNIINNNSSVVSPIINYRLDDIVKNNIDFKSVIEYSDFSFMDIYTQRELFNIVIDFAITQCIKSKKTNPVIILKTKKLNSEVVIQTLVTSSKATDDTFYDNFEKKLSKLLSKYHYVFSKESKENVDSILIVFRINCLKY